MISDDVSPRAARTSRSSSPSGNLRRLISSRGGKQAGSLRFSEQTVTHLRVRCELRTTLDIGRVLRRIG